MAVSMGTRARAAFDVVRADHRFLNEYEQLAVLGAVALSPFRFMNFFGVNIGPVDVLLLAAFVSYVARTRTYPTVPSLATAVGIGLFLAAGAIGVVESPRRVAAFLDYTQYVYLFAVAVPIAVVAFADQRTRRLAVVVLAAVLNALVVVALAAGLLSGGFVIELAFGNQNQLYWRIAAAFAIDIAVALNDDSSRGWRAAGAVLAGVAAIITLLSQSYTAILFVTVVAWSGGLWYIWSDHNRRVRYGRMFIAGSVGLALVGLVAVIGFWETITGMRTVSRRILMYQAGLRAGIEAFPFGAGLASGPVVIPPSEIPSGISRSMHNFAVAYFMQLGVPGLVGFALVLGAWVWSVLGKFIDELRAGERPGVVAFAPVGVFAGYFVIMSLQPVPVSRLWWLFFALSWGWVASRSESSRGHSPTT